MTASIIVPDTDHPNSQAKAGQPKWIYMAASAAAVGAGLILLVGIIGLPKSNNWLLTILKLHAGSNGVQLSQLYRLNTLDLALLALIAIVHAGLFLSLHRSHRILTLLAVVQLPLGILLLLLTHSVGRSSVMGAGLAISLAMLRGRPFSKWLSWIGIVSNALLFAGDLGTGIAPNRSLAFSTGIGYILLTSWLLAVAYRLCRLAR